MTITADQIDLLNRMNGTAFKVQLGTLIYNAENVSASEIALAEGSVLVGNSSAVGAALDVSTDAQLLLGDGTTLASVALSGDATVTNAGVLTVVDLSEVTGMLNVDATVAAGASAGHKIKETATASGSYSGTHAGLSVKMYDPDTSVVHAESELAGLYINLKQLSAMTVGGKSALISAHNYGSGGDYQVVDFGLRLFGDLTDAIEVTGGTVTSAIKLDTCTALTNVIKLADGVGCTVGSDGMTKNPESDTEDAFLVIDIAGTSYQIAVYTA